MTRSTGRDELTDAAADAAIEQACRILRLPTIREHHARVAEAAARQKAGYKGFLVELLSMECDEREDRRKTRLIRDAGFPRPKRIDDFDFTANPLIDPGLIHTLAKAAWVRAGQPLCLIGDSGTGKSHLLIGLGIAAAEAGYRVRYVTAAALVNELVEAADDKHLSRTIARYGRVDLLCLDELGYLELDRRGAELLFQVFTEREERASVAVASNSAFSEWARTFTDPRLCAAIVDRITFEAHIVETGTQSYRLRASQRRHTKTPGPARPGKEHHMIDTNGGVDDTDGYDSDYDRVTAHDIAEFLHHLAELRNGHDESVIDPAQRAAFLSRKADLFTRLAEQAEHTRIDAYSQQIRQMADTARAAADHVQTQLPQQRLGPTPRRTPHRPPTTSGARSQENPGASSG
jgi:DNA replication protein DnaC